MAKLNKDKVVPALILIAVIVIASSIFTILDERKDSDALNTANVQQVEKPKVEQINLSVANDTKDANLSESVAGLNAPAQNIKKIQVQLIGAEFGEYDSDIGNGLKTETPEQAGARGGSTGAVKSVDDDAKKKDAVLALYFKGKLLSGTSPRDSIKGDFPITVKDNKNDEATVLYNSLKNSYIGVKGDTYGVMLFAVYSDSTNFYVNINNKNYDITTSQLNYIKK